MAETMTRQADPLTDPLVRIVEAPTPIYWDAKHAAHMNRVGARLTARRALVIQKEGGCGQISSWNPDLGPCVEEVDHDHFHRNKDGRRWAY
jgi:hypothetical protein